MRVTPVVSQSFALGRGRTIGKGDDSRRLSTTARPAARRLLARSVEEAELTRDWRRGWTAEGFDALEVTVPTPEDPEGYFELFASWALDELSAWA